MFGRFFSLFGMNYVINISLCIFFSSSIMNNNRISTLETGCFVNLSSTLQILRLNRNRLSTIPAKIFQLPNLQHL